MGDGISTIARCTERRYRIAVALEYLAPERMIQGKGRLRDVSLRGMYVEDPGCDLDVDDPVQVPLALTPRAALGTLRGRVVRVDTGGFALRLEALDPQTEARLRAMLPLTEQLQQSGCRR